MRVLDPGHKYELTSYDGAPPQVLTFVKRNTPVEKYPGNKDAYGGTLIQEVVRALIDRMYYVNNQQRDPGNLLVIREFREAIRLLEVRAAQRHGRVLDATCESLIETFPTCNKCGHVQCNDHFQAQTLCEEINASSAAQR